MGPEKLGKNRRNAIKKLNVEKIIANRASEVFFAQEIRSGFHSGTSHRGIGYLHAFDNESDRDEFVSDADLKNGFETVRYIRSEDVIEDFNVLEVCFVIDGLCDAETDLEYEESEAQIDGNDEHARSVRDSLNTVRKTSALSKERYEDKYAA